MSNQTQRDAFWDALYEIAFHDRNTYLVCADMGARGPYRLLGWPLPLVEDLG